MCTGGTYRPAPYAPGMKRVTRRTALVGIGSVATTTAVAGCGDRNGDGPVDDGGSDDGTADGSGDGDDAGDGTNGGAADDGADDASPETAVHQVGEALTGPAWRRDERVGFATLIDDQSDGRWPFQEADAATREFVAATDLGTSVLLYVESVGPTTCDREIAFDDVAVEDGTLVGSAAVMNAADGNTVCGEAITYSGALLRVTTDPLPGSLRLTVTDGWGNGAELSGTDPVRDPAALDGFVQPGGDPPNVPAALDCPDDAFERHPSVSAGDVDWGSGAGSDGTPGLELRVVNPEYDGDDPDEALRFERGDAVRVEMTNVAPRPNATGNHAKYALEVETDVGWTDVRGTDDGEFAYTDELVGIAPGETVEWAFTMTEAGLVGDRTNVDLRVCPDLRPGRYRFRFFGADDDIAAAFDYVG